MTTTLADASASTALTFPSRRPSRPIPPTATGSPPPADDEVPAAWVEWLSCIPPDLARVIVQRFTRQPPARIAAITSRAPSDLQRFEQRLAEAWDGTGGPGALVALGASIPDRACLRDAASRRSAAELFHDTARVMGAGDDLLAVATALPRALALMELAIFGLPDLARIGALIGHPGDAPELGTVFGLPPVLWAHPLWALAEAAGAQEGQVLHGAAAALLEPAWRALVDAGQGLDRVAWALGCALGRC